MADKATIQPRPGFDWWLVNWGAPDQPRTDRCSYCGDYFPDASDGRAPIEALSDEPFEHDFERHMAEERGGADAG